VAERQAGRTTREENRQSNITNRQSNRQDFANNAREDQQNYRSNAREDWQEYGDDHYHGHWGGDGWYDHPVAAGMAVGAGIAIGTAITASAFNAMTCTPTPEALDDSYGPL
jgi:hypothetical protein